MWKASIDAGSRVAPTTSVCRSPAGVVCCPAGVQPAITAVSASASRRDAHGPLRPARVDRDARLSISPPRLRASPARGSGRILVQRPARVGVAVHSACRGAAQDPVEWSGGPAVGTAARGFGEARALAYSGEADAGWSSSVARWAHNPEVIGSNPIPATSGNLLLTRTDSPVESRFFMCATRAQQDQARSSPTRTLLAPLWGTAKDLASANRETACVGTARQPPRAGGTAAVTGRGTA